MTNSPNRLALLAGRLRSRLRLRLGTQRNTRLAKGVLSVGISKGIATLVSIVSLPMAVRYLGADQYGLWVTVITTVLWVNILDLGIANTLTNSISRAYANEDKHLAADHFTNALAATLSVTFLGAVAALIAWHNLNWVHLFNVGPSIAPADVNRTVAIALILVLSSLPATLGSRILNGYQETHLLNAIATAGSIASLIGLAVGIYFKLSMPALFILGPGIPSIVSILTLFWILFWHKPWLFPRFSYVNRATMKDLLSHGLSFFMLQIAGIIVFQSDNIVISHYLGTAAVTPYSVTWRLFNYTTILQIFLFPSLWPAYAEANERKDYKWIRKTFRNVMLASVGSNLLASVLLVAIGKWVVYMWTRTPAAIPNYALLVSMGIWTVISSFMNVEACLLGALNRVRIQGIFSILAAIVNIGLSIILVKQIGSVGVILGTIISYVILIIGPINIVVLGYFREIKRAEQLAESISKIS